MAVLWMKLKMMISGKIMKIEEPVPEEENSNEESNDESDDDGVLEIVDVPYEDEEDDIEDICDDIENVHF